MHTKDKALRARVASVIRSQDLESMASLVKEAEAILDYHHCPDGVYAAWRDVFEDMRTAITKLLYSRSY